MSEQSKTSEFAILYVDDEEMALKYFRRAVGDYAPVYTASNVSDALALLEERSAEIGVLVTDQRMPGQTGVDLLRRVRDDWPDLVRLLTTAYSELDDAIDAVNRGEIFRYINKPWDVRELRTELRQAMEVFHLRRERSLLLEEKLSVWQRLVDVGRARDLVVLASGLTHARNVPAAMEAYLSAELERGHRNRLAAAEALDMWQLTEKEMRRTANLAAELIGRTTPNGGRDVFDEPITADRLIETGTPPGLAVSIAGAGGVERVTMNSALTRPLVEALLPDAEEASGESVNVRLSPAELPGGQPATAIAILYPEHIDKGARGAADRLAAYVTVYHHGGSLKPLRENNLVGHLATLPTDPAAAPPIEPSGRWPGGILAALETWDA